MVKCFWNSTLKNSGLEISYRGKLIYNFTKKYRERTFILKFMEKKWYKLHQKTICITLSFHHRVLLKLFLMVKVVRGNIVSLLLSQYPITCLHLQPNTYLNSQEMDDQSLFLTISLQNLNNIITLISKIINKFMQKSTF